MDLTTVIGVIMGFALIGWAMFAGGTPEAFLDIPSMAIVFGGSVAAALIAVPGPMLKGIVGVTKKCITKKNQSAEKLIDDLVSYAEVARRDGILSLETMCKDIDDPFIVRGIQMAVDGTDPELIEQIMNTELENLMERHEFGRGMFSAIGKYAPAFGMIGTLIGLVAMLANMEDPKAIGPAMAIALLTTLYGTLLANVVFIPIGDKLRLRAAEETLTKNMIIDALLAIQSGQNPRVIDTLLRTYLPEGKRDVAEE